ncbi:Serine/threonine-protein kinase tel-1 [Metarhizium album ARSEF 1941]|uniref:Serine/threonine-protein kinase Tel1 n=1 Tax=Metarhizium album (strain ARSEF 1941) TaxID=1081103 RepID=A0A0B2X307_METAS|nr:Serine/threonine-protein kinase tel-1 [Metarhizium album ARSEF 1941]KHO00714.1 Serine/threonine-protein kinase tel-1 [Metarhizium album ARSEF 1941]
MASSHTSTVMSLTSDVKSGSVKAREKAVDELVSILNPRNRTVNLADLGDKSYHQIFEALFNVVIRERPTLYDKGKKESSRKAATTRLTKCASAIRMTAARGASRLGRKTLLALIDHISQVLPDPDGDFVAPLIQDYVKALSEVLSRQPHVEYLARQDAKHWEICVDFLLDIAAYIIPSEAPFSLISAARPSPAPDVSTPRSIMRSNSSTQSQKRASIAEGEPLRDALEGLQHLSQASNAPIARRGRNVTDLALRVLNMKHLSLGSMQAMCFLICNTVFAQTQSEDLDYGLSLVRDLLPLMSHWWRAEKVSQDELIKELRNEISKTIYLAHSHIEHLSSTWTEKIQNDIENLVDPLWQEYSRRSEPFRLQLRDLTFNRSSLPGGNMHLNLFGIRNHNSEGESHWALVQNLSFLESILLKRGDNSARKVTQNVEQPRKRQRTRESLSRLRLKLRSRYVGIQRTALQILPFLVEGPGFAGEELASILDDLVTYVSNKDPITASWALVASASCASLLAANQLDGDQWKQLWHLAVRSVSIPTTCRAACLLLHQMIEMELLPYNATSEDIDGIVTTADVNGPGILCDTSLILMFHLFHARNAALPSASQATSNHIIRWVFLKWNPNEPAFASSVSPLIQPLELVNLLRVCCGVQPLCWNEVAAISGTTLEATWRTKHESAKFNEYLLLLKHKEPSHNIRPCIYRPGSGRQLQPATDSHSFYPSKRLAFELFCPKLDDLVELCDTWSKKPSDGGTQISLDRYRSLLSACIIGSLLIPQFADLNTPQSASMESNLVNLAKESLVLALDSVEPQAFLEATLRVLRPCMPGMTTVDLNRLYSDQSPFLHVLTTISSVIDHRQSDTAFGTSPGPMDLDDEFGSQISRATCASTPMAVPRQNVQLCSSPRVFHVDTKMRLGLLRAISDDSSQIGLLPEAWIDGLLLMSDDDLLCCQALLLEISTSDLVVGSETAYSIIKRLGEIISTSDYQCCEVALTTCIEILDGWHNIWLSDNQDLAEGVGDLYNYFIKVCLPSNFFSAKAQMSMARLLFSLLGANPAYGTDLGLASCRTSLLTILATGSMPVKCFVADRIAGVFDLFILMLHDEIFVDVLASLPTNPADTAGIAFRLLALSKLACRWPTLLRRCIYHIFETPGKISQSIDYAKWCLADVSSTLKLESPKELFLLFSRQLLYTWMEHDPIEDIPFAIFGFDDLKDLLRSAQAEAIALAVMRTQESTSASIATLLGMTERDLIKRNFSTTLSYSMAYADAFGNASDVKGEDYIRKKLGSKGYVEAIYTNLVDIIAAFFDLIDQEDNLERIFRRHEDISYAADNLEAIKKVACSSNKLPPNQQPMFRAKYIIHDIFRLCQGTEFQFQDLWTPALVLSVTRSLFNTIHAAMGSLYACSVLRKVRLVISLAGSVALESYCLEMLLNSVRGFIVDAECADDALGLTQYLLSGGRAYLTQKPSFLAGYALSTLASLRVFLESSQSSTTQDSQFKATMNKTQKFHDWFSKYLSEYASPVFQDDEQSNLFKSITHSAAHIRSSGNAEKGTSESKLLVDILRDGVTGSRLLNESSRELALKLLCGDFTIPATIREDIVETDAAAIEQASSVWKSCEAQDLSKNYLSWAGRVVGRSFAASGEFPGDVLKESNLSLYRHIAPGPNGSETWLLCLLQDLAADQNSTVAGLAEAALRETVTRALEHGDEPLVVACQRTLSESLFTVSQWGRFCSPDVEATDNSKLDGGPSVWEDDISSLSCLQRITTHLASTASDSILLSVLTPILTEVPGFAEKAFPFIVHLVLCFQHEQQQTAKRQLSMAMKEWLRDDRPSASQNVKLLINTVLYLRTQEYPKESSIADRMHWLGIDYAAAAASASRCGMQKTALLFAEWVSSEVSRPSRRSSAHREHDINDILLTIFENIDDPDTYYGLPEDASLSKVVARVEYENEGLKSLAFRGAQYDSHIRLRRREAEADGQALVQALGTLGLSGLAQSILQTHESLGASNPSVDSTFTTARRLEMWNLPAPGNSEHHAVILYQAYKSIHNSTFLPDVQAAVYEGFSAIMKNMASCNLNATALRSRLAALAALTELDDMLNISDPSEVAVMMEKFKSRSEWMRSGMYGDVGQVLSCRETSVSMLCQHTGLLKHEKISADVLRQMQVESMILSSGIYRYHQATQESLNIATALSDMIPLCESLNLHVDAAIRIEVANSLWDHGEMGTSIRMLQAIDRESSLTRQSIRVNRSDLLSKIGHKVSLARLENPHDIQKTYLGPALKELKREGNSQAGSVYHQFATFCDEQLQDPDGLEDLARLHNLRTAKKDEVNDLKALIDSTKETQLKARYAHVLSKEKQWLELDEKELKRVEQTRSEFVQLSLENYLLSLISSDDYNNDALRFTALWLERSAEDSTNKAVMRHLSLVPTRKFAPLMNQLTSRLQSQEGTFQKLLFELIYTICVDHPYHGMYQIWSGTKARAQQKDEVAVQRVKATEKVAQRLSANKSVANIWLSIDKTSKYYHGLAMEKNPNKYKSGAKIPLKDSAAGQYLVSYLARYRIPPPTLHIEVSMTKDYSDVPFIHKLEPTMTIASGVSAPKIITAVGTNGVRYKQLVKGGHDDLRQDAIMEQVFAAVSSLLKLHRSTQQRNLGIRTYKVLPLTASSGLIEFVPNTIPLHEYLMPAHEKYYPRDLKGSQCRKEIFNVQSRTTETRLATYRKVTERFHPVMRYFFMEYFVDPDEWFARRLAYTRSTAAISMLGHVLGLGDRHGHNILLDCRTGEAVHIDLGVAFEAGRILPVPELVPFRLTRDIVDGMGITRTEGVFRRCCEFTLDALREEQYSIMAILDVLRYDPLYTWSISPLRLAKLQNARNNGGGGEESEMSETADAKKANKHNCRTNEPSEADRALEVVRKKLSKTLSVTATVNDLINMATDERNLAVLYSGWAAYA